MTADPRLIAFLAGREPLTTERETWPDGAELELSTYLTQASPPMDLVTSVRAVVVRDGAVVVFEDDRSSHVIPGGRLEAGEPPLVALARELQEEIGCEVAGHAEPLGIIRLRHVHPVPDRYPHPHPDFLNLIYLVRTRSDVTDREEEPLVRHPRFMRIADALVLPLRAAERALLAHVDGLLREGR